MDKEFGFIDLCDLDKKESADHIVGVVGEETVLIPANKLGGEKDWNVNNSNDPRHIKNKPIYMSNKTLVDKCNLGSSVGGDTEQGIVIYAFHSTGVPIILDFTIGKRYTITFYKKDNVDMSYTFNGISANAIDSDGNHAIRVKYTDNENVYVYNEGVRVPIDIYREFGDRNILMSMTECVVNVQDEYLPLFQPDFNITDEKTPGYIKNKPVYLKKDSKVYVSGTLIHDYDIEHVSTLYHHYDSDNSSWMFENNEGVTFEVTFTGSKGSSSFEMVGLPMYELCSTRSVGIRDTSKYSRSDFNFANGNCTLPSEVYYQIGTESESITYTVRTITDKDILCKSDGTPLDKSFAIDSEKYRYGDELLKAIVGNRIPLIKIPNEDNNDLYDNYVLPWQMQVPKNGNDYVNVFYTKDKFAQNLVALLIEILTTGDFTNLEEKFGTLFGEMELQLHNPCEKAPIECEDPLD